MPYRLTNIASNAAWKQPTTDRTHTLTFREYDAEREKMGEEQAAAGMGSAMAMSPSFTRQYTAEEASAFELGALYEIGVTPAT